MECTVDYQNKQVSFSSVLVRIKFEHCLSETVDLDRENIKQPAFKSVLSFFLHNLLVFFSLLLSSCLVSKSYCGTKTTETIHSLSIDGPWAMRLPSLSP